MIAMSKKTKAKSRKHSLVSFCSLAVRESGGLPLPAISAPGNHFYG